MMNWPRGVRSMRLEVEHLRFHTRLASESDSKVAKSERHSSPGKSRGKLRRRCCQGGEEAEGDQMDLCNYCMSQYLD
jgi:hypothetical protein